MIKINTSALIGEFRELTREGADALVEGWEGMNKMEIVAHQLCEQNYLFHVGCRECCYRGGYNCSLVTDGQCEWAGLRAERMQIGADIFYKVVPINAGGRR
jgi:hypothetical protein